LLLRKAMVRHESSDTTGCATAVNIPNKVQIVRILRIFH